MDLFSTFVFFCFLLGSRVHFCLGVFWFLVFWFGGSLWGFLSLVAV